MKCNKCGAEWKVDQVRAASITVCPFCREEIGTGESGEWRYFDNTKELLEYVAVEYGSDVLFGRKHFSDHSSPLMPQRQKNLAKQAFECGAVKILQDNMASDQKRREIAVKQAVGRLVDAYASTNEAAERIVWEFTNAIGWGMAEPQEPSRQKGTAPGVAHPPASGAAQTPIPAAPQPAATPGIGSLMTRGWQFAEDGDWKDAADYFNKVLDAEPQCAPAAKLRTIIRQKKVKT